MSGFGELFKTGGKVVKNVTGYDLCKLLAGSWGTLAVMTEVTLKVMPKPEAERTLLLRGLDDVAIGKPEQSMTLLRLEGTATSAAHRAGSLARLLADYGGAELLEDTSSAAAWAAIRDVIPFAADGPRALWPIWRIVCPPAAGGAFGQTLARDSQGEVIYDWGGGLIWAALPPVADANAGVLRKRVEAIGGHAMLIRAPEETRRAVDVFHPQPAGVAALNARVKQSFDPKHILNRGRMVRGTAS